ncbi:MULTISPECIES: DUF5134 domain-containing protein [unclassified Streptomyces]|uniref:DUF5134 domain-containing protein n=1 Tax=unclassified Streptomyces TaxID=2593676 RepID=UPI002259CE30|nr:MULTISPECIES: DUF5134 domain-containing protein [unclassified Streptomyces]MCX5052495.1 DUF5134 domain-containing protein [Streptomyces sp. NBC_00474]
MSAPDVVYGMLTALFGAATVHALRHSVLSWSSGWLSRGDHLLHTVMALAMTVMPWHWGGEQSPQRQTVFFAAAALWFPLTARLSRRWPGSADLVRRPPDAVGMAAMAAMAWMPVRHGGYTDVRTGDAVTGVLTLCLLACALRSLTRDMPALRGASGSTVMSTSISGPCDRFWQGSTAMGTAIMLLMHH